MTLYATACDWIVAGSGIPDGVGVFLMASFFNAIGIEIGRKVRAPADEEHGVTTYSAAWGVRWAVCGWMLALATTATLALIAAARITFVTPVAFIVAVSLSTAATIAWRFLRWQERSRCPQNRAHVRAVDTVDVLESRRRAVVHAARNALT